MRGAVAVQVDAPQVTGYVDTSRVAEHVEAVAVSPAAVAALLVALPVVFQLNARLAPWTPWHARTDGQYLRSWWAYAVLNWASAAVAVGLVLASGSGLAALGLAPPEPELALLLAGVLLVALSIYYRDVLARPPLDDRKLERARDGWTPATRHQRLVGVFVFGVTPGICEEVVYRGFAITALLSIGIDLWPAIALATVPYVLLHGRGAFEFVRAFATYAALGVGFAVAYLATGSLWVAMVAHAAHNLAVAARHTRGYLRG